MDYPKIFLTIDNCFAIKRWIKPLEWMQLIKEMGVAYIEASTDNECDPLFNPPDYLADWIKDVRTAQEQTGVKVVNFYTGYQTYRTVGLAHPDARVRQQLVQGWFQPMIRMAAQLGAGVGFSFHALPVPVLQSPPTHAYYEALVMQALADLARYAWEQGPVDLSVEQMYAPHQPPWTIAGAQDYLKKIYGKAQKPCYITIDVGHQVGQRKFLRLTRNELKTLVTQARAGETVKNLWLGSDAAYDLFAQAVALPEGQADHVLQQIEQEMDRYPYLFAAEHDGDPYQWLEAVGCYSPIMHLQQNNGLTSHHAHFSAENNQQGIIRGDKVLRAIARSYEHAAEAGMPPKCKAIYLAFEIFAANTDNSHEIVNRFQESVQYWRQFIPQDGLPLNELL